MDIEVHFFHVFLLTLMLTVVTCSAAKEPFPQDQHNAASGGLPLPDLSNGNQRNLQTSSVDDGEIMNLAEHPACRGDIQRLCHSFNSQHEKDPQKQAKNSLDVLECFINHDDQAVSKECHQVMWEFKSNVTRDPRIAGIAGAQCVEEIKSGGLKECERYRETDAGHYISCLVEEKTKITDQTCLTFVNKVALVIFSDYRLVGNFTNACETDIKRLDCGVTDNKHHAGHSQGATLNCLVKHLEQEHMLKMQANQANDIQAKRTLESQVQIGQQCSHQILRLLELQADDFHLDRALFFACRDDREKFCHEVQSGGGKVYQCLMTHKDHEQFSKECKEQLVQREVAAQTDYKIDYGLGHMCMNEIQKNQCMPPQDSDQGMQISYVILCLEGVIHKSGQQAIGPQCMQAVFHQRQALMSDFNISPNIVVFCKPDIEQNCKNVHPKGIIHCLMGVAKEQVPMGQGDNVMMQSKISAPCSRELNNLLLGADVAGDVRVDTLLYEACQNIIDHRCSQVKSSAHLMGCLMQHMQLPEMSDQCEMRLLESHFFVTRDIRLDAELFEACKDEAVRVCNLKDGWTPQKTDQSPETGPLTFSCLYRHTFGSGADKTGLSQKCMDQVKTTLHQRALAMEIPPEVDVSCIHDLAYYCADKEYKKGQEFSCLQEKYAKLQKNCQAAVQHYTQAQQADVKLSATYKNCAPMLDKYCRGQLNKESTFDDAMDCLIPYKDEPEMSAECMAEIHHYQLINIQEYQLNIRFKESCKEDIINFCNTATRDIGEVIVCLSSIFRDDTLSRSKQRISKACRAQLRHELLARAQEASLDPMIKSACDTDIQKLCPPTVIDQGGVLECLRQKVNQLTSQCHKRLFKVEQLQAVDEYADYTLVQACRRVIEKKCRDVDGDQLLPCLIEAQKNGEVDPKCEKVIATRQLEEYKDVRLNPALYKSCNQDMEKHCKKELKTLLNQDNEAKSDVEDDLISCLKKHKKSLSAECGTQVREMTRESAQNYKLDPKIADVCAQDIKAFSMDQREGKGEVMEHLKELMKNHKLKDKCAMEVARRVAEGKADIYVDPILYSACQVDLNKLCYGIEPGEGRQYQCLTYALSEGREMSTACRAKLQERIQFVKYAAEISGPENLQELASSIVQSPSRYYFLSVTGGFLLAVLVIGMCCGRATKRVRRELKNR